MNMFELPETAKLILERIENQLIRQCEKGKEKYGESIDQAKDYDWNQMALEELVDCIQYLMKENIRLQSMTNLMANSKFGVLPINYEDKYNYLRNEIDKVITSIDIISSETLKNYMASNSTLTRSLLAERFDSNQQIATLLSKILEKEKDK